MPNSLKMYIRTDEDVINISYAMPCRKAFRIALIGGAYDT